MKTPPCPVCKTDDTGFGVCDSIEVSIVCNACLYEEWTHVKFEPDGVEKAKARAVESWKAAKTDAVSPMQYWRTK